MNDETAHRKTAPRVASSTSILSYLYTYLLHDLTSFTLIFIVGCQVPIQTHRVRQSTVSFRPAGHIRKKPLTQNVFLSIFPISSVFFLTENFQIAEHPVEMIQYGLSTSYIKESLSNFSLDRSLPSCSYSPPTSRLFLGETDLS